MKISKMSQPFEPMQITIESENELHILKRICYKASHSLLNGISDLEEEKIGQNISYAIEELYGL